MFSAFFVRLLRPIVNKRKNSWQWQVVVKAPNSSARFVPKRKKEETLVSKSYEATLSTSTPSPTTVTIAQPLLIGSDPLKNSTTTKTTKHTGKCTTTNNTQQQEQQRTTNN